MWFDSIVTSMKNLYIALNKGLRRILNLSKYSSASEMFVNQNMPSSMSCYEKLCVVLVVVILVSKQNSELRIVFNITMKIYKYSQ